MGQNFRIIYLRLSISRKENNFNGQVANPKSSILNINMKLNWKKIATMSIHHYDIENVIG